MGARYSNMPNPTMATMNGKHGGIRLIGMTSRLLDKANPLSSIPALVPSAIFPQRSFSDSATTKPKRMESMPGPRPILPGIGTSWVYSIIGPYSRESILHSAREDMFRKYGPIYKEHMGGTTIVSIHKPKHIEAVMHMQGEAPFRVPSEANIYIRKQNPDLYNSVGLVDSGGEEWKNLRRKVNPAIFNISAANTFIPQMNEICNDFVNLLRREKDSRGIIPDIRTYLHQFGLEVMWKCALGDRLNCLSSTASEEAIILSQSADNLFHAMAKLNMSKQWWKRLPSPTFNLFREAEMTIFKTVNKYSRPKMEALENQKTCPLSNEAMDVKMYDTIIERFLLDKTFDRRDVNTVIVDLIAAGVFTTTYALSFFLHRLGREPEAQKRLQAQLDLAFASDPESMPSDINRKAPLLKATIKEGFRCETIIPGVMRLLDKPITLDEYEIPPFTPILCQSRAAGLADAFFTSPQQFIPERWLRNIDSNSEFAPLAKEAKNLSYLLIPYGVGARMCIGERLAQLEISILLSKILKNFIVISEGKIPLKSNFIITPGSPVKLKFIER